MDEIQQMREGIAKEYGITMYKRYAEPQAAAFLGIDPTTLKRLRRAGKVPSRKLGPRKIYYIGLDIINLIAFGDKWRDFDIGFDDEPEEPDDPTGGTGGAAACLDTRKGNSKSENTGSVEKQEAPHGAERGSTPRHDRPDAHLLAQTIFKSPSRS